MTDRPDTLVWESRHGAPPGPEFSVVVQSSREGHGPYRISRDTAGTIRHEPPCERWSNWKPCFCRHVREATESRDGRALRVVRVVGDAINSSTWWAREHHPEDAELLGTIALAVREFFQAESADYAAYRAAQGIDADEAARAFSSTPIGGGW